MLSCTTVLLGLLASTGLVAAQPEAARFGIVNVSPATVKPGEVFVVHYNSTLARHHPKYLDIYIQGTILANNYPLPKYLLARKEYGADQINDYTETTLPILERSSPTQGYSNDTGYGIWAWVTYPIDTAPDAALEYGGIATGIGIDLS